MMRMNCHNDENHASSLLKEQQSLNALFSNNTLLLNISISSQQTQQSLMCLRRSKQLITHSCSTVSLKFTSMLQATISLKTNWKSYKVNLYSIYKHHLNHIIFLLSLWLTDSVDDKKIYMKDYVFVRCSDDNDDDDEEGKAKLLKIVRIKKVYFNS